MESPQHASPPASLDTCHLSDVSFPHPENPSQCPSDSFAESQQYSADPNAFLGFHVPPGAEDVRSSQQQKKQTLKLVLNLNMTTDDITRGSDGFQPARDSTNLNPFSDLFVGDTQDDVNLPASLAGIEKPMQKDQVSEVLKSKKVEKKRSLSPPLTMLKSMDNAWKARKQKVVYENKQLQEGENNVEQYDNDELILAFSEYSEELTASSLDDDTVHEKDKNRLASGDKEKVDTSVITEDSDREMDYEDGMECTQQLIEEDVSADETRNYEEYDDEETEMYPSFENGTLSIGADSGFEEDINHEKTSSEQKEVASGNYNPEPWVVADRTNDQGSGEDEVTSREGSQGTQQDYLTPRVNPCNRVGQSDLAETNGGFVTIVGPKGNVEQISKTPQNDDDQEECVPTQPSRLRTEGEPVVEPNSPSHQNVKKSDELSARKHITGTDSQTKAIRSLEFSFSIPESQEGEPHFSASPSGNGTPAAKRLEAFTRSNRPSPFESSISPVSLPTSTPTQLSVDTAPELAIDNEANPKRKTVSSLQSDLHSDKKKPKTMSQVIDSPGQATLTTIAKTRNGGVFTPDNKASSNQSNGNDPQTPRPPVRRSPRSTQSTPSSTPTVRTRTRTLTPVPLQRTYVSRSRTLFKYKFEFCLTGFVKTGEKNLKELIEGHGGKIPERYQDVLYKTNLKAIVIATPVSWRKRKFMQAVACGIPVVHTDWIKDCIEAGHVIPFDGYQVPIGYSVTTRKFECFPPRELQIFEGYSFGIASDVAQISKSEAKDKANLMTFILKACGAKAVYENLFTKDSINVDVVLCDEYTPTCRYYKRMRHIPVKDFQWVTECMILQQLLDPEEPVFEPQRVGSEDVFAASAEIGDSDNTTLKLYKGELVMADIAGSAADRYLLFNVCEILSIHVSGRKDEGSQSKRNDCKESRVTLRVGMLKREPYNPELSKTFVKVLDISSFQVKRRVVAVSKKHYSQLKYKDESIFYLEDELSMLAVSETSG